jgi:hypothetical protein
MSPEGVVLGADSTSSAFVSAEPGAAPTYHYLNHNQKLFEVGQHATVGMLTWGLGGLSNKSYRTEIALLADALEKTLPKSIAEIADRWAAQFWAVYSADAQIQFYKAILAKATHDPNVTPNAGMRTNEEENAIPNMRQFLAVGFCIAGYLRPDRMPGALQVNFDPNSAVAPTPIPIPIGAYGWWGVPNVIKRLINGSDDKLRESVVNSGKWKGTRDELDLLLDQHMFGHPLLPIRDAIDFVHSCIYSTIKAMKFSNFAQICGGPIELGVITTDRDFRWVRHKTWDAAIFEGDHHNDNID